MLNTKWHNAICKDSRFPDARAAKRAVVVVPMFDPSTNG